MDHLDFETTEQGLELLKRTLATRNSIGGALYYNIVNDMCANIANKLFTLSADLNHIESIIAQYGGGIEVSKC